MTFLFCIPLENTTSSGWSEQIFFLSERKSQEYQKTYVTVKSMIQYLSIIHDT